MFLLKKAFQLRDKVNPEMEKPFLEHLDDLRITIMRVIFTLVVSMIVAFSFQDRLMHLLRHPVDQVWVIHQKKFLPDDLDTDRWEEIKHIERAANQLDSQARDAYFHSLPDTSLRFHVRSLSLLRAALSLPEASRTTFLNAASDDPSLRNRVTALLALHPDTETDSRGNLRMMSSLRPTETFMLSMKLSMFAGIVLSFPLLVYFILQFVLPGLHRHETKLLWPALAIGFGLFLTGVCFAYFLVLPRALEFFYDWGSSLGVSNDWRIGEYITFATQFTLLFGAAFELPVVVMVLVKLGFLGYEGMSNSRSYAIVAIFITAAIIVPDPSVVTMCLLALPMVLLYECCIWMAWWDARKKRRAEAEEDREREIRRRTAVAAQYFDPEPPSSVTPAPHLTDTPNPETPPATTPDPTPEPGWQNPYDTSEPSASNPDADRKSPED